MKWLQVLLFNTNDFIQCYTFICAQLNGSKYCYASLTIQLLHSRLGLYNLPTAPLQKSKTSPNECPDGEVPVMLELCGKQSISSLPSLPGLLWPKVVAPDSVLSMG